MEGVISQGGTVRDRGLNCRKDAAVCVALYVKSLAFSSRVALSHAASSPAESRWKI